MWRTAVRIDAKRAREILPGVYGDLNLTCAQHGVQGGYQPINWYPDILDRHTIEHLAGRLGATTADIESRLLWNQIPDLPKLDPDDLPDPKRTIEALTGRWWARHRARVCAECLDEATDRQAIPVEWQSAWTFACLKHSRLLSQLCPTCDAPYQLVPTFPTTVRHDGVCADLAQPDPTDLSLTPQVLEVQAAINGARDQALAARDASGEPVPFYDRLKRAYETARNRWLKHPPTKDRVTGLAATLGLPADTIRIPAKANLFPPARTMAITSIEVWQSYERQV